MHRLEQQPAVLDLDMLAFDIDGLAGEQIAVDVEELARHRIALVVIEEDAVALVLDGIAAGDDVDQKPAIGDAIERRRHPRRHARRLQAGPHSYEVAQPLGPGRDRRSDDPGILAASPGRQQHAEIAELVGGLRDLAQVVEIDIATAGGGAEIMAVTMGRQEPEDIRGGLGLWGNKFCHDQDPGLR